MAAFASLQVGCVQLYSLIAVLEPTFSVSARSVIGLPVLTEDEFREELLLRRFGAVSSADRRQALAATATLNDDSVHALTIETRTSATASSVLIVARQIGTSPVGATSARDFYVVAAAGISLPPMHRVVVGLERRNGSAAAVDYHAAPIECSPLPGPDGEPVRLGGNADGSAGVLAGVRLGGGERAVRGGTSERKVELRIFASAASELLANSFVCARAARGAAKLATLPPAGSAKLPTSSGAVLISEETYRVWSGLPGLQTRLAPS